VAERARWQRDHVDVLVFLLWTAILLVLLRYI
jgi:hypothetical protein